MEESTCSANKSSELCLPGNRLHRSRKMRGEPSLYRPVSANEQLCCPRNDMALLSPEYSPLIAGTTCKMFARHSRARARVCVCVCVCVCACARGAGAGGGQCCGTQ